MDINRGLPTEEGRLEIFHTRTKVMREHNRLAKEVNLEELAARTKNFTGAEIEALVRAAQATAMNRLIKMDSVLVDTKDAEKVLVTKDDFEHALTYDVKPFFGISEEQLDCYVKNGIIEWDAVIGEIIDRGVRVAQQTWRGQRKQLVSLLLHGIPGSGKTALAAEIARQSGIPFVKVVTPVKMIGYGDNDKCHAIKKVFDDAYKSELSCIIVDDMERVMDYVSIGPRFSNAVLQTLLVLLRNLPPNDHCLLVIGTTSAKQEMDMMGLCGTFQSVVEVPPIRHKQQVLKVVSEIGTVEGSNLKKLEGKLSPKWNLGIKKLIGMADYASQAEDKGSVVDVFIKLLEEAHSQQ